MAPSEENSVLTHGLSDNFRQKLRQGLSFVLLAALEKLAQGDRGVPARDLRTLEDAGVVSKNGLLTSAGHALIDTLGLRAQSSDAPTAGGRLPLHLLRSLRLIAIGSGGDVHLDQFRELARRGLLDGNDKITPAGIAQLGACAEEHEARREAIEGGLKRLRWEEAMADETLHVRSAWEIVCKPPLPHAPVTRPDETLIDVVKRVVRTTSLEERESLKAQAPRPDGRHPNKIYVDAIQDIHRLLDLAPGVDVVAGVKALVTALCPRPGENVTAAAARLAMVSVRMDAIGEDYEDIFAAREALGARRGETLAAAARRAANLLTRLQALGTEAKTVLSAKGPKSASSSQNETSASD